jgi:drug/metabolite transporter (DMT)-like permease
MVGAGLALLAAATFGLNNAMLRRGVLTGSALQGLMITVPMGVPLFALGALGFGALGGLAAMTGPAWLWFAVAGVVHFIIGRYGNYRATRAMGANLSGPVQQLGILVSLVLAMLFLGERLNPLSFIGIALVLFGPLIMLQGSRGKATASGFVPRYGEGLLWGVVNALGHGSSPLFIAWGLEGAGIGTAMLGGLVSYGAATVLLLVLMLAPVPRRHVAAIEGGAARWFAVAGFFVFVSQMFRYAALAVAPVSVVAPIQRLSVVFRVLFGWLINREHEVFGVWVLTGIALSLLGAALLTLSVDWVAALMPFGAAALNWRWP